MTPSASSMTPGHKGDEPPVAGRMTCCTGDSSTSNAAGRTLTVSSTVSFPVERIMRISATSLGAPEVGATVVAGDAVVDEPPTEVVVVLGVVEPLVAVVVGAAVVGGAVVGATVLGAAVVGAAVVGTVVVSGAVVVGAVTGLSRMTTGGFGNGTVVGVAVVGAAVVGAALVGADVVGATVVGADVVGSVVVGADVVVPLLVETEFTQKIM